MEILKVSAKSSPNGVAGAIAGLIKENGKVEVQAIGAGAVNQTVKAVTIARGFMVPTGVDIVCSPAFTEVSMPIKVQPNSLICIASSISMTFELAV